ncbi:MAG: hypothetical protein J6A54_05405, partial [Clostridia bacterium]|nr:hypothetical protein [Clostridia bacterium]
MSYIDKFYEHRWGVFNHFLYTIQNNPSLPNSYGRKTSWDELVNEFNVQRLAFQLNEIGTKYYVITVMQGTKYMIAPNATFDKIAGTLPGEACSTRDLIMELSNELEKYGIDLFLYFTGDGPYKNEDVGAKFGFIEPRSDGVTMDFVKRWASVLEEYSLRYGDRVKGWWVDGCYKDAFKYTDEMLRVLYDACKAGNPDAIVALNGGLGNEFKPNFEGEDFVCGEFNELGHFPKSRFTDGAQAHVLAPLGTGDCGIGATWGSFGLGYDKQYITDYVCDLHDAGGVVTFDIGVYRDGSLSAEHIDALKYVARNIWCRPTATVENKITLNFDKEVGKIKVMHAVNNGPVVAGEDQTRGNQNAYKSAKIPYARTHDASFYAGYGGEHTIDVHAIFPSFDADENDEASYDFACTDNYIAQIFKYGAKPFYRLGSKIEHEVKKYGTIKPKDFNKWARICEHIIAHYTEGWAKGFKYDIEYWEIWNEPDLDPEDSTNKRCWSGTEDEFAQLYVIASKHLKSRFPHLKIGGPALAWNEDWLKRFLARIAPQGAPLDFLSWHWYGTDPKNMSRKGSSVKEIARRIGYGNAESILNEWNYVRGWDDDFIYSIEQIIGMKGAAFTSACMACGQGNPDIDMLMYYDARPGTFNGLFDFYTMRPLKGYYPFLIYSRLYELENQTEAIVT